MAQQSFNLTTSKFHADEAVVIEKQTFVYNIGLALHRVFYEYGASGLAVGALGSTWEGLDETKYPSVPLPPVPAGFYFERIPAMGAEPSYPDDVAPIDVRYLSPTTDEMSCQARVIDPTSVGGTDVEWSPTVKLWVEALNANYGAFH